MDATHEATATLAGGSIRRTLTRSYTAVTVAALLVVELVVLSLLFGALALPGGRTLAPERLADALAAGYVAPLVPMMASDPPDRAGLGRWLASLEGTRLAVPIRGGVPILFEPGEIQFAAVDRSGTLLAATDGAAAAGLSPASGPPPTAPALRSAAGRTTTALPVVAPDGSTLGALWVSAVALTPGLVVGQIGALLALGGLLFLLVAAAAGSVFGRIASRDLAGRIGRLAATVDRWSAGAFDRRLGDLGADELGRLGVRLDAMAARLADLIDRRGELAAAEERRRLSRDLHDSVKQQALAAAARLAAGRARAAGDPDLAEAAAIVDALRRELNDLIDGEPDPLAGRDLDDALRELSASWSRRAGVALTLDLAAAPALPSAEARTLFRAAQGALANIERHGRAARARLALSVGGGEASLRVEDDGVGFDPAAAPPGFGLRSLRERAEALRGSLSIESAAGSGTALTVRLPLQPEESGS